MATDDCIKYRIGEHIVTTMRGITVVGGYKHTLESAQVFIAPDITQIPDPTKDAILIDILESTPIEDLAHTIDVEYAYMLRWYRPMGSGTTNMNDTNKNCEADMMKALKVDITRGGLAHYTECGESGPAYDMDTSSPYTYMNVKCKTTINGTNPYST